MKKLDRMLEDLAAYWEVHLSSLTPSDPTDEVRWLVTILRPAPHGVEAHTFTNTSPVVVVAEAWMAGRTGTVGT